MRQLHYDVQRVIRQFVELYRAFKLIEGREYELNQLNDTRLIELVSMGSSLLDWIALFNTNVHKALQQKMGIVISNP